LPHKINSLTKVAEQVRFQGNAEGNILQISTLILGRIMRLAAQVSRPETRWLVLDFDASST
jgi:hypothetical protein